MMLDLTQARTWDEVVALVSAAARETPPGDWIIGRGWHQDKWEHPPDGAVEGFPVHQALSTATPQHPVLLQHASGHASFCNARAMELAGIGPATPDPKGGEILRDSGGRPTGLLRENAENLAASVYERQFSADPQRSDARLRRAIQLADRECLSKGLTSFQDAGSPAGTIRVMQDMVQRGEIGIRLWVMAIDPDGSLEKEQAWYQGLRGVGDQHLTVRAIKRVADGALGSRGAWLLEPYADAPDSTGLNTQPVERIAETAKLARAMDFQLCVHAIGDRANREVLDIFERTFADDPAELRRRRWRVEHAQHLHPADAPRFARLGVVASMQGIHCTSDAVFVVDRLGEERARTGAYMWRALWESGALVSNGTDAPVEDVDPIACFHATVVRQAAGGTPFFAEQRLTRLQALRSYTVNAATAAFEENLKGSLRPGKLADIVVLSKDILTCPEDEILQARVLYTIVGGKILHQGT
jgi:predicted amidohydrolase YtcJ